mgnify:CR=1 FL=1
MTKTEFEQKYDNGKYVLFFTADWCPDCQFIKPVMPEIEAEFSDFKFLLVDRDENIDFCQEMFVMGIPSFIVYVDGKEKDRFVNKDRKTKEEVEAAIEALGKGASVRGETLTLEEFAKLSNLLCQNR